MSNRHAPYEKQKHNRAKINHHLMRIRKHDKYRKILIKEKIDMAMNAPGLLGERGARLEIAQTHVMNELLAMLGGQLAELRASMHGDMQDVLASLVPDPLSVLLSIPANTREKEYTIGNGGEFSVLRKITLVKITPGAFPSSVQFRHDDISGQVVLDSSQLSVDFGVQQFGERHIHMWNNDPVLDAAVIITLEKVAKR